MKSLVMAFVAGLVLTTATTVRADEAAVEAQFKALDADHNGVISAEEAAQEPNLVKVFKKLDTDQDGQLNPEEFKGFFA
ncbi:EF-hand domain-containing protein [Hahella sp. SMD15-11]|uniref:EF-hand domain-containing protein n=1 Tax=Thermohahella caldifontis TaxID=3142973 RepID=A0AB39UUR2_9GAMM